MINLIKLELYKLRRLTFVKILLVFVILLSAFSSFSAIHFIKGGEGLDGRTHYINLFQDISILMVNAVFISIYIGSDFMNRTIQSQIARGIFRSHIVIAKSIGCIITTGIFVLIYPVVGALVVSIENGWGAVFDVREIGILMLVAMEGILLNIGTNSFFILISFYFRDVTKSICFCLAFPVLFSIIKPLFDRIPVIDIIVNLVTLSQIRNIGSYQIKVLSVMLVSVIFSSILCYRVTGSIFKKAEMK